MSGSEVKFPHDPESPQGVLLVTTENGSRHRIDFDRKRVVRYPDLGSSPKGGLRRDEDELQLLAIQPILLGQPMTLVLDLREDGVATVRQTGNIVAIERLK